MEVPFPTKCSKTAVDDRLPAETNDDQTLSIQLLEDLLESSSSEEEGFRRFSTISSVPFKVSFMLPYPDYTTLPWSVIFGLSSGYITINGNEENCGSSFSDPVSSVMAGFDLGGLKLSTVTSVDCSAVGGIDCGCCGAGGTADQWTRYGAEFAVSEWDEIDEGLARFIWGDDMTCKADPKCTV